ncbi:hypothetical protein PsorP6_008265 [Peronosclerospora sorghi]|uniref:Uncharacterized protein n=1 Tax=Peronosclerospora sorghi TaxID=230839 RepID=A0ACC0W9W1_9STRA|nr:hypothetical protein PsorP6_008265 [Peronosclerospora sorghi]
MNTSSSTWSDPKVSRLWSAKGDELCSPPRSDDYKEWSLTQLKREITQRQLKTNPRRRNKDAFVRVLLHNDEEQAQMKAKSATQNALQTQEQTIDHSVLFVPTSSAELQNILDQQQELYGSNSGGQPQDEYVNQQHQYQHQHQQQHQVFLNNNGAKQQSQQQTFTGTGVVQAASMTPAPIQIPLPGRTQTSSPIVPSDAPSPESEMEIRRSLEVVKRQRMEKTRQKNEKSEKAHNTVVSEVTKTQSISHPNGHESTEYKKRKLTLQAARLEIESRRLELEIKREQRNSELHAVQLALAQEQLQQAKITTQKLKTEWIVDKLVQKKRMRDAGIAQADQL